MGPVLYSHNLVLSGSGETLPVGPFVTPLLSGIYLIRYTRICCNYLRSTRIFLKWYFCILRNKPSMNHALSYKLINILRFLVTVATTYFSWRQCPATWPRKRGKVQLSEMEVFFPWSLVRTRDSQSLATDRKLILLKAIKIVTIKYHAKDHDSTKITNRVKFYNS